MNIIETKLPGVYIIEPKVFSDARGFFCETFRQERYSSIGIKQNFVQDNLSSSKQGVLRGLHYQLQHQQGKLVSVFKGSVFDVAVDIRIGSPHFGQWVGIELSADNHRQLYIPPGFAHGFCVLSEDTIFHYKCTDYYHPEDEYGILWNDPMVNIHWPTPLTNNGEPCLSNKDLQFSLLKDIPKQHLPIYQK